jgi:hypothetical protein
VDTFTAGHYSPLFHRRQCVVPAHSGCGVVCSTMPACGARQHGHMPAWTPVSAHITCSVRVYVCVSLACCGLQKTAHREFKFGRSNGHWTINGETWDTVKIAGEQFIS